MRDTLSVLAFGAHPDDIEFACGGVSPADPPVFTGLSELGRGARGF